MKPSEIRETKDVYSSLKATAFMEQIEKYKKGELFAPRCIQVDLEGWCPHNCTFCYYRNSNWQAHGMKFMDLSWAEEKDLVPGKGGAKGKIRPNVSGFPKEIGLSIPSQMNAAGIPAIEVTGGGESLAWPWIRPFIEQVIQYKREFALVTNGQLLERIIDLLPEIDLKWLRFSMDSYTPRTHSRVHDVSRNVSEKTFENVRKVIGMKLDAFLGISFIITSENYPEIIEAAKYWKNAGVQNIRFSFEYEPAGNARLTADQIKTIEELIGEAKKEETAGFKIFGQVDRLDVYKRPNTDFDVCGYQLFTWAIGYNMKVWPCCILKYRDGKEIGDLSKESLEQIVHSEKRKKYMEEFDVKACPPCWLRSRNQAIETLIAPEKALGHLNYV